MAEAEGAEGVAGLDGDEHHAAATKLQAVQRGKQDRAKVEEKKEEVAKAKEEKAQNDSAAKIQAVHRGKAARAEVEKKKEEKKVETEQHAAATKVQAAHRGKAARAEVAKKREGMAGADDAGADGADGAGADADAGAQASSKKLHNPDPVYLERVFKIFDKQGDRSISEPRFIHVLKVMGDDLRDEECSVVYRAVNTHWKEEGNTGINYADFTAWIECTVLGMAVYDALVDQFE